MSKPKTLVERMRLLFSNGADIHFLVGESDEKELIPAHKTILASASDVFEAMFRFDAGNTGRKTSSAIVPSSVVVPDVEAEAFRTMLVFIYTDDLSGIDGDNLFDVLYASKKYNIVGLVNACLDFPIPSLPNVFFAFAQARFLEEKDFARRCMEYIEQNMDTLHQSDAFLEIDQSLLSEVLDREKLAIEEELTIWRMALHWADGQCRQKGLECSAENRRKMLGPALFKIRFPRISKEDFTEHIVPCGVLSSDELVSVLLFHDHPGGVVPSPYPLPFATHRLGYTLNGRVALHMDKLVDFTKEQHEDSTVYAHHLEETVHLRGLPLTIVADLFVHQYYVLDKRLDLFLDCNVESAVQTWSCNCTVTRRIPARTEGKADYVQEGVVGAIHSPNKGAFFHHFMLFNYWQNSNGYRAEDEALTVAFDVSTP